MYTCLVSDSLGDEGLARTRRAVEEHATGGLDAEVLEQGGMAQRQLDHLADLSKTKKSQNEAEKNKKRKQHEKENCKNKQIPWYQIPWLHVYIASLSTGNTSTLCL